MSDSKTYVDARNITCVPVQPDAIRQEGYIERVVRWNPYSHKNQALCYEFSADSVGGGVDLFPDACANFLFKCSLDDPTLIVSGVSSVKQHVELDPGATYFGFKPYSVSGMKKLPFSWEEMAGTSFSVSNCAELFGQEFLEGLLATESFEDRCASMLAFAVDDLTNSEYTPDFVEYSEAYICESLGNLKSSEIGDCMGYSDRWCRKRFKESMGVSIKSYSSIMRFQSAFRQLSSKVCPPIASVAFDNGYFDQPHLTREFKRYTGETPLHFRRRFCAA